MRRNGSSLQGPICASSSAHPALQQLIALSLIDAGRHTPTKFTRDTRKLPLLGQPGPQTGAGFIAE